MGKRKRKPKKNLRREVEILKAQLSSAGVEVAPPPVIQKPTAETIEADYRLIKKDIFKTIFLSVLAFSVIITIWLWV